MTIKPSLRAAIARRSSSVTSSSDAGRRSDATKAAPSWRASAVRRGCTRRNRVAASRTRSLGSTSSQAPASSARRSYATVIDREVRPVARSARASAETHSIPEPHHTSIAGSSDASACIRGVDASAIRSGTIAEASQNLICPLSALPAMFAGEKLCRRDAGVARTERMMEFHRDQGGQCPRAPAGRAVRRWVHARPLPVQGEQRGARGPRSKRPRLPLDRQ
jgi:hypothetical protein